MNRPSHGYYRNIILKERVRVEKKLVAYGSYLCRCPSLPAQYIICMYIDGKFIDEVGDEVERDKIEHLARLLT